MESQEQSQKFSVEGASFLITGGTGSFGLTMTNALLKNGARSVLIFSRDESKQFAIRNAIQDPRLTFQLGDIREIDSVQYALRDVEYVFHAAALKHVPASEDNPMEYVKTNVLGSHSLLKALTNCRVKSAVFLSTDKAVYPVNAMGMSKALMEKLVRSTSYYSSVRSCITRYGNVIGSRGSVIPYFIECIKADTPIKVTDLTMTRFVMSLQESVDLVLHAMSQGQHGELFVRKAPSATLKTILQAVEKLLEKRASLIDITGVRPGEKIHETLLNSEERTYALESTAYFKVPSIAIQSGKQTTKERVIEEFRSDTARLLSVDELVSILEGNEEIRALL
jgi:UDP-N-acetylglucosamine 4,6-dehydratase